MMNVSPAARSYRSSVTSRVTSRVSSGGLSSGLSPGGPPRGGSAASIYGGAGGSGSLVSWGGGARGARGAWGLGPDKDKETMQGLNVRLASYLDQVRGLEADNGRLEAQIRQLLDSRAPQTHDWTPFFNTVQDLRDQIFARSVENANLVLGIDNARLAADDFRVKYETELAMRQSVESDIHGLRKVIDDTNVNRLQLETEIETLKQELLYMKKNHQEEVQALQRQIAGSGLTVEVDAPKPQDLGQVMADLRAKYEALAEENRKELDKYWSQQIEESTVVMTSRSEEAEKARAEVTELRRRLQSLEIELDTLRNLKGNLEGNLEEVEMRYRLQLDQQNGLLLHLEAELVKGRAECQQQARDYGTLLDVKSELEAEIDMYRQLLDGNDDFSLRDALDSKSSGSPGIVQSVHKTTRTIVDGKVVSETNDSKVIRR
ncbi:keratin, type I cytoskeletal 18 [Tachyglossus aculeatus]|uniref:keratin, type I cytoskeletal 18 n=1 Tax=Tachyglossus aculeatus TaxID=9261 RepID=UPI0018F51117|nr:keratin, type I cytoskeletal 18 [Tachyglossus aculeatus]